jgi:hypothetical protein
VSGLFVVDEKKYASVKGGRNRYGRGKVCVFVAAVMIGGGKK